MKLLLVIVLVLAASLVGAQAEAQETYTQGATAPQVLDLTAIITADNEDTCESRSLAETCTQAQVCVAAGAVGGASCTAVQARAAGVRIYPLTFAGRDEYVLQMFVLPRFAAAKGRLALRHLVKCRRFWIAATPTQKNTACQALGIPSSVAQPCELCAAVN